MFLLFLFLEHPPEWRLHQSLVCHEDIPDTQHPHHHDLVLETDYPHEPTTCAAGEVSSYLNGVTRYLVLLNSYAPKCDNSILIAEFLHLW